MILYIVLVTACSILFFIFSNQLWFEPISKSILNMYAKISNVFLNLLQQNTTANDGQIVSPEFSISIKKGCDAIAPMILYIFAIAFFPVHYMSKIKGILYGILILAVLNTIRIISLFLIGKYTNDYIFDIMHVDIWQIAFIIFTVFIWVKWLQNSMSQNKIVNEKT
nr:exosortase/archaeosortase family protein [Portibacter lacus]